ncbi:MAG: hypothetical protein A2158_01645 [Chloroflexi bacterium RBG_13_46_14]|nr:MAG: hypothetical protein A2158_01645 [Chloroflexi bacterium RBG_13_46_14]
MNTDTQTMQTDIIKVKYFLDAGKLSTSEYTYRTADRLEIGDLITVPVRNTTTKAQVSQIDVSESEIEAFKDKVKIISAGSKFSEPIRYENVGDNIMETVPDETPQYQMEIETSPEETPEESTETIPATTDITLTTLRDDPKLTTLAARGINALAYAEKMTIIDGEGLKKATTDLALLKGISDELEEKRKEIVRPINNKVKSINEYFQTITKPIGQADEILRKKVLAYNAEVKKQIQEAEKKEEEKMQQAREEAAANHGEITVDLTPEPAPAPPPKTIHGSIGTVSQSGTWKYEVEDFAKLPDEYKTVNTSALNSFIKSTKGSRQIPGVRIYFEENLRVRK